MSQKLNTPRHARARAAVAAVALLLPAAAPPPPSAEARPAQERKKERREKGMRVTDSILGVRVEDDIREVHAKLGKLGTVGGDDTREGGRKEAWTFKKTAFKSLAYETNREGRVEWLTAFVRPGKEIPFSKLGDLERAQSKSDRHARWIVEESDGEGYVLMVKGGEGKASVVQLFALDFQER